MRSKNYIQEEYPWVSSGLRNKDAWNVEENYWIYTLYENIQNNGQT